MRESATLNTRVKKIGTYLIGVISLCVFTIGGTILYIVSFYDAQASGAHTCAVVFGAAVWPGGVASHALSDRVHEAVDIYEEGAVSCLIFSGAPSVYGRHEVDVMYDVARERGVADEDIEADYHGVNTQQTLAHLTPDRSYVLVSNDFHLARIHMLAQRYDVRDYELQGSEYRQGRYSRELFFVFREAVALWYYALMPQSAFE